MWLCFWPGYADRQVDLQLQPAVWACCAGSAVCAFSGRSEKLWLHPGLGSWLTLGIKLQARTLQCVVPGVRGCVTRVLRPCGPSCAVAFSSQDSGQAAAPELGYTSGTWGPAAGSAALVSVSSGRCGEAACSQVLGLWCLEAHAVVHRHLMESRAWPGGRGFACLRLEVHHRGQLWGEGCVGSTVALAKDLGLGLQRLQCHLRVWPARSSHAHC